MLANYTAWLIISLVAALWLIATLGCAAMLLAWTRRGLEIGEGRFWLRAVLSAVLFSGWVAIAASVLA